MTVLKHENLKQFKKELSNISYPKIERKKIQNEVFRDLLVNSLEQQ